MTPAKRRNDDMRFDRALPRQTLALTTNTCWRVIATVACYKKRTAPATAKLLMLNAMHLRAGTLTAHLVRSQDEAAADP